MKFIILFCAALLVSAGALHQQGVKKRSETPAATLRSGAAQEARLCDECICETCPRVSRPLPEATPVCAEVVKSKWDLWKGGTCLRGVNTWQKVVVEDGETTVQPSYCVENLKALSSMKANYVNISFPGIYSVKQKRGKYVLECEVLTELKRLIDRCREADLFVVVSFRTGPGRNEAVFGGEDEKPVTDLWTSEAARDAWVEMWKETARELKYKSNVVGYDLMVEPVGDVEQVKDASQNRLRFQTWYELAGRIAKEIRRIPDDTPILVGGANASAACALECLPPIDSPGIVYAVHQYAPYNYTHQTVSKRGDQVQQKSNYDCKNLRDKSPRPVLTQYTETDRVKLKGLYQLINGYRDTHNQVPVVINEYGVYRWAPGADRYLRDEMGFIELLGANHALWLWEPDDCVGYDAFNFRHGPEFSNHRNVNLVEPPPVSPLIGAIKDFWTRNTFFPSNISFPPGKD